MMIWKFLEMQRHGAALFMFIGMALILGGLALYALTLVPPKYRKPVVAFVTLAGGLFLALEFLLPPSINHLEKWDAPFGNALNVIGTFALLLGLLNLFEIHGKAVCKLQKGWINSAAFFVAFFAIMIAGFLQDHSKSASNVFEILFSGFIIPLQSTTFSLIAFYIVSAAYRAFRIKTAESVLMMSAAAIIMLSLVPLGASLTAWIPEGGLFSFLKLENIGHWILVGPNMAVQRALAFGIGVGALATALRIWLSLERGSFFDRQL